MIEKTKPAASKAAPASKDESTTPVASAPPADPSSSPSAKTAEKKAAKENQEVKEIVDHELEQGFRGAVPDPEPNSAHSLLSGPDSPPLVPDNTTRAVQHAANKEA